MGELVSEAELDTFISEGMQHAGFREEFEKAFDSIELKEAFRKWFKPFYGGYGRLDWEKNLDGDFEPVWIQHGSRFRYSVKNFAYMFYSIVEFLKKNPIPLQPKGRGILGD